MKIFKTQLLEAVTVKSDSRAPDKLHKSLKEMLEFAPETYTSEHNMCSGQEREVLVTWKVKWKKNWISHTTYKPLVDKLLLSGSSWCVSFHRISVSSDTPMLCCPKDRRHSKGQTEPRTEGC